MHDVSSNPAVERRRSQRVSESVPLIVRGIDLLGHPFEERTETLTLNLQGCRYFSRHHLPRNSWISIEVANSEERRNVRARVAWIHRPHSIRDLFQIAVELEGTANIWGLQSSPAGWEDFPPPAYGFSASLQDELAAPDAHPTFVEGHRIPMTSYPADFSNNSGQSFGAGAGSGNPTDQDAAVWRERLSSEMAIAQREWDELLQSSIDRTLQRVAEQLPERAQEAVRATEEKMAQQFANLSQMLAQLSSEAQNALAGVKASIDQETWRAREAIENLRQQMLDRVAADAEARVAPHSIRVPELLRELSGREEQMSESLRLHRERLRQASDSALREVAAHVEATAATVRLDFEAARTEALAKWNEELDALNARLGHSASESLSRTSEWLQQETRERLQVLSEQTLATAAARLEEETTKAAAQFATHLEGQSIFHLAQVHQQLDGVAEDLTGKTRTQLAEAAEAAAASFGQVLHNISAERAQEFSQSSQSTVEQKRQELENYTQQVRSAFESDSSAAMQGAREQTASHLQSAVAETRNTLANESAAALDAHRNEHAARAQEWTDNLNRIAEDAAAQCNGRIQNAADAWTIASVRRLNEHGQNVIESLMRSADQALRDSASKMFEGLAAALREQAANANSAAASASSNAPYQQDSSNQMPPPQDNTSWQPNA
ncbi:MAG TPA: hypothetical protein VMB47_10195 [Candidatus Aquilonibacter sp.]|nr:hypothetical protein [Candidatus Aquilonibacter sp.]